MRGQRWLALLAAGASGLLATVFLVQRPQTVPSIEGATRISASDQGLDFIESDDPAVVSALSRIANEFLDDWRPPESLTTPLAPLQVRFFRNSKVIGSLGIGSDFVRREQTERIRAVPRSLSGQVELILHGAPEGAACHKAISAVVCEAGSCIPDWQHAMVPESWCSASDAARVWICIDDGVGTVRVERVGSYDVLYYDRTGGLIAGAKLGAGGEGKGASCSGRVGRLTSSCAEVATTACPPRSSDAGSR